ncbi:MAG: serine protease [Fischerella sp. CENA71]|nr:serine protease [Fischerella sp. CENA71]
MKWHKLKPVTLAIGMLLVICASAVYLKYSAECVSRNCEAKNNTDTKRLSVEQIRRNAKLITVKVISKEFLGTGILLKKQDSVYTVLTNAHVLRADDPPYRIQTPDGRSWSANSPKNVKFGTNDLAILQFRSPNKNYTVASIAFNSAVGDEVFAAGFPYADEGKEKGFTFTTGKITLKLPKALEGGYQIGYTNDIQKGMSGGPLLNHQGEVVGVNGMHAYPLWDAPSVFSDGSEADQKLHEQIVRLSWAVPTEKFSFRTKITLFSNESQKN